jgi:hypothetical protein
MLCRVLEGRERRIVYTEQLPHFTMSQDQDSEMKDIPTHKELEDAESLEDPSLRQLERETRLRLDILLIPLTLMLYLLAWLDRANVGNARVAGMAADLKLSDWEYKTGK